MMQIRAVDMIADFARRQIVKAHPFGVIIDDVELGEFLGQKSDLLSVWSPKRFPSVVHQLAPVLTIDIHDP